MRSAAIALIFCLLGYLSAVTGSTDRLEYVLRDARTGQVLTPASGAYVLVAIDAKSLEDVGKWPWSRQVHADLVDQLNDAGAAEIFFDIDFSFAGDAEGDAAFAQTLAVAGNIVLPRFVQTERFGERRTVLSTPYAPFAENSWPVSVNVTTDRWGLVRDYPMGIFGGDGFIPSAAAFLTGRFAETSAHFSINSRVDPASIPSFSASDVLSQAVPRDAFENRVVIVGATAIALGDYFNVPVHGVVPGALIHAMAAETLDAGTALYDVRLEIVLLALFALLVVLQHPVFDRPRHFVAALIALLAVTEAAAFGLLRANLVLPTAPAYGALALFSFWHFATRLGLRDWVINRKETEIRETRGLLAQVFYDSFDALLLVDETGKITQKSRLADDLFKRQLLSLDDLPPNCRSEILQAFTGDGQFQGRLKSARVRVEDVEKHFDYTIAISQVSEVINKRAVTKRIATVSVRDTTLLRQKEREIAYLSTYDPLTGALRRNSFADFLDLRLSQGTAFALLAVNLSRFKSINLLLGREVGDAVLVETVARLERVGLGLSAPARLDGDTFAVFSEAELDDAGASELARQIKALVEAPFEFEDMQAKVGANIGYSICDPAALVTARDCLAQAEAALDAARATTTAEPQVFSPSWSEQQNRARAIERAMVHALEREEFYLTYQPQHRVSDGRLIGSEALVRWHSAELGPVFPDEFIEIAESNGFITDLGRWVLKTALLETLKLPGELDVAVNVSGVQMSGNNLMDDVVECLSLTGFPSHRLCLELTESVLMSRTDYAVETMRDIRFLGPTWALDDFGTGYSSLAYLAKFPLEKLKLDRSFTDGLGEQPSAETIVRAVKNLSNGLGMKLLCEGVETQLHLDTLRACGCDEVQGYHFAKPMALDEFRQYVSRHHRDVKSS